jgi:hypothetical protein
MQEDLTFGEDIRGDQAFFIEEKHFIGDGWQVDDEAKKALGSRTQFFRVIDAMGEELHGHGWVEGGEIVQWG